MSAQDRPKAPSRAVKKKQDPAHTEADFMGDLEKVATNEATKALGDRANPKPRKKPKKKSRRGS